MSSRDVRWGFIGAGFIATTALAPALHAAQGARLRAAASRDPDRARRLEPDVVLDDYRQLVEADDVDAVYISLSNEAHLHWILESLRAGKHVLCEKPLTMSAAECATAHAEAQSHGLLLVEATWTRWHPRHRRADALLGGGAGGTVRSVRSTFTFDGVPPGNYRLDAARGGGALLDLGPYLLTPIVDWCSPAWTSVTASAEFNELDADLTTRAVLSSSTTAANLHASIAEPELQTLEVVADDVTVTWGAPAHTSWRSEATLTIADTADRRWEERFEACDAYQLMVEDVSRAICGETSEVAPTAGQSLAAATLIEQIAEACRAPDHPAPKVTS